MGEADLCDAVTIPRQSRGLSIRGPLEAAEGCLRSPALRAPLRSNCVPCMRLMRTTCRFDPADSQSKCNTAPTSSPRLHHAASAAAWFARVNPQLACGKCKPERLHALLAVVGQADQHAARIGRIGRLDDQAQALRPRNHRPGAQPCSAADGRAMNGAAICAPAFSRA